MLWSSLLASVVVLGCTHSNVQPSGPAKDDVYYLKPGERQPAAAPLLIWHPAVFKMDVTQSSESRTLQGRISQEMVWKELVTTYVPGWQEVERDVPGMCSRAVCPQATGQSELWTAYFKATTKTQKADALAKAIEGIGEVSSKALVEKGYFRVRPRSWTEFENEIQRAANAGVIKKNVATMVTDNYQNENINKLGYKREACTMQKYSCTKTIVQRVSVQVPVTKQVEKRSIVQQRPIVLQVRVNDAKLLSYEKDQLVITVDQNNEVVVDGNGFNRYKVTSQSLSGPELNLEITADSRVLRDLPGNAVLRDSFELVGDKATFVVELDPKYMIEVKNDPNAQFEMEYQLYVCEYGWSGTCGFSSWKKLSSTIVVLPEPRTSITLDVPAKNKAYIAYRVVRKNSDFYNSKPTYERSTDSLKMPKIMMSSAN